MGRRPVSGTGQRETSRKGVGKEEGKRSTKRWRMKEEQWMGLSSVVFKK